jgi:hypothetical protein
VTRAGHKRLSSTSLLQRRNGHLWIATRADLFDLACESAHVIYELIDLIWMLSWIEAHVNQPIVLMCSRWAASQHRKIELPPTTVLLCPIRPADAGE